MKYMLIADDDPMNQCIFVELFEESYELLCVEDGIECLDSIAKRKPDLLLLDYSMPKMNGIDVCKKLRDNPQYKDLPIIIVTGHASEESKEKCLQAGASAFMPKPFDLKDFRSVVAELIS